MTMTDDNDTPAIDTAAAMRAASDRRLAPMRDAKIIIPMIARRLPPKSRTHSRRHRAIR